MFSISVAVAVSGVEAIAAGPHDLKTIN